MKRPSLKTLLLAALVVLILLSLLGWRAGCKAAKTAGDQATIADGRTATAVQALDVIADNAAADAATQTQVNEAQDAVLNAAPADRERVARYELCKLQGRSPC
jgi:hypothetical protein